MWYLFSQLSIIFILLATTLNRFAVSFGYNSDRLPHLNTGPVRPNRWLKSKPETNGNTVRRKPEARCDSQIDSHRRCSAATYVRLWNVAPPSAGVLWALRHSPTMCLSTPQGRAGSPLPRASISLPGHRDDTATPQLQSLCPPRRPLTLSSSAMHRGHRVLSERGWRCRLLLTAQPEALLPQSQCTGRACVADAEKH